MATKKNLGAGESRKQVGAKCRCSWNNGKARCGQKVAGVGDGDKEELGSR